MNILRRITYSLLAIPVMFIALCYWIITGKSGEKNIMDPFYHWGMK